MAAYGNEVPELTRGDFENLLVFRTSLRRFAAEVMPLFADAMPARAAE